MWATGNDLMEFDVTTAGCVDDAIEILQHFADTAHAIDSSIPAAAVGFIDLLIVDTFSQVKVTPKLSAYNLRHAFATRLKQSKMSDIDVSRCLGHISMKTKSYYGRSNTKSGGGLAPDKVTSKLKPRENVSQHPAVKARPAKVTQAAPAQTTPAQAKPRSGGMKP